MNIDSLAENDIKFTSFCLANFFSATLRTQNSLIVVFDKVIYYVGFELNITQNTSVFTC